MSDITVTRKKGESFEAMFRRFTRRNQQSGKKLTLRAGQFHQSKPSKNKMKTSKLRGLKIATKRNWMIRVGKINEDDRRRRGGRRR